MTYATSDMVKQRMGIPTTDSTRDSEIIAAIAFSDALCNGLITDSGGSAPVGSPTQLLREASADFAAYYIYRISNATLATLYYQSGATMIGSYIRSEVAVSGTSLSGKSGVRD